MKAHQALLVRSGTLRGIKGSPASSCGECSMCCDWRGVSELRKPPYSLCKNINSNGAGCSIYLARPQSCKAYQCLWLSTQTGKEPLPLSLRPDKSGVIVEVADEQRLQLTQVVVDPQRIDAWRQPGIARLLGVIAVLGRPLVIMTSEQRVLYSNTPVVIPDEQVEHEYCR